MCGIVGIIGSDFLKCRALLDGIAHRGPDALGVELFESENMALGHARLAILDLDERSNQPMHSDCGGYTIIFNGEIYNYKELKSSLISEGIVFKTESDTEVLLYWLISYGPAGINFLDGMFSFSFYNKYIGELVLARDHIGEKPLYYSGCGGDFAFCSEINPLLELSWVDKRLNKEALRDFLFFLYAPAPNTFFNGIKELKPGDYLVYSLSDKTSCVSTYFDLSGSLVKKPTISSRESDTKLFKDLFFTSVESRLVADVPLSVFLSGGLDSNAIVSTAKSVANTKFKTFTVSYQSDKKSEEYDESRIAKECASFYGIENQLISFNASIDFFDEANSVVDMFGQPFGNATCIVAKYLAAEVSKSHRVCLVGDGGDELLAGYPRYKAIRLFSYFKCLPGFIVSLALKIASALPENGFAAIKIRRARQFLEALNKDVANAYLSWVGYCDNSEINKAISASGNTAFYNHLISVFGQFSNDPVRAAEIVDFLSFVPFNLLQAADRTSMASSLELRAPFVAKNIVINLLNVRSDNKFSRSCNKPLLVDALRHFLPAGIISLPKKPFNPPMHEFVLKNIPKIQSYLLTGGTSKILQIVTHEFLVKQINDFSSGKKDNSTFLWGLVTLECWLRRHFTGNVVVA